MENAWKGGGHAQIIIAPKDPAADALRAAVVLEDQGKYAEAADAYRRILTDHPDSVVAWTNLGNAQVQLGEKATAEEAFRKALAIDGTSADALNNLAWLLYQEKRLDEAEQLAHRAVAAPAPDGWMRLDTLARIQLARGSVRGRAADLGSGAEGRAGDEPRRDQPGSERSASALPVVSYSRRSDWNPSLNAFSIARAERERSGDLLDLTISNPTRASIPYPLDELSEAIARAARAPYDPQPLGVARAREAVAREIGCDAADVVITASTSEAYSFLFKLLCDPGDAVLTATPSYPLLEHLAALELIELHTFPLEFHRRWELHAERVREAMTSRTKAIVVVNPNNPTGSYVQSEGAGRTGPLRPADHLGRSVLRLFAGRREDFDRARRQTQFHTGRPLEITRASRTTSSDGSA